VIAHQIRAIRTLLVLPIRPSRATHEAPDRRSPVMRLRCWCAEPM